jgi:hypothetical protein
MPGIISIKLLKDSFGTYAIDVHPTVLRVSPADNEEVILTFELDFEPSTTPNLAQAIISFEQTPFNEEPLTQHRLNVGSITIPNPLRDDAVGPNDPDVSFYKYTVTVITPEGTELPPLDPHVMVKRKTVSPRHYH